MMPFPLDAQRSQEEAFAEHVRKEHRPEPTKKVLSGERDV
jgi:hypothetical protein